MIRAARNEPRLILGRNDGEHLTRVAGEELQVSRAVLREFEKRAAVIVADEHASGEFVGRGKEGEAGRCLIAIAIECEFVANRLALFLPNDAPGEAVVRVRLDGPAIGRGDGIDPLLGVVV